jgi:hypothetical protein
VSFSEILSWEPIQVRDDKKKYLRHFRSCCEIF